MKKNGFTLIELIVTVAIVVILASIGLPTFNELIKQSTFTTVKNSLIAGISFARSEAVKRNNYVSFLIENNAESVVFVDDNANGVIDNSDVVLKNYSVRQGYKIKFYSNNSYMTFRATGEKFELSFREINIISPSKEVAKIQINAIGRASIK